VVSAFTVIGTYQLVQQQWLTELPAIIPGSSSLWFILALVVLCISILEGAYRRIRFIRKDEERKIGELNIELDRIKSKLANGKLLFVKSCGFARLSKNLRKAAGEYQRELWWYRVVITNPSQTSPMGIQRIFLTWDNLNDTRQINAFLPVIGPIQFRDDEREPEIKSGDFGETLHLQPSEPKSGTLVFIIERGGNLDRVFVVGDSRDAILVLVDSNGIQHKFPARNDDILS